MHIEKVDMLTEIKGRDDKLPVPDAVYDYRTINE